MLEAATAGYRYPVLAGNKLRGALSVRPDRGDPDASCDL